MVPVREKGRNFTGGWSRVSPRFKILRTKPDIKLADAGGKREREESRLLPASIQTLPQKRKERFGAKKRDLRSAWPRGGTIDQRNRVPDASRDDEWGKDNCLGWAEVQEDRDRRNYRQEETSGRLPSPRNEVERKRTAMSALLESTHGFVEIRQKEGQRRRGKKKRPSIVVAT